MDDNWPLKGIETSRVVHEVGFQRNDLGQPGKDLCSKLAFKIDHLKH